MHEIVVRRPPRPHEEQVAALAIGVSTLAAGVVIARRPVMARLVAAAGAGVPALAVALAAASRRTCRPPRPSRSGSRPPAAKRTVRIVVPARDEAAVIGDVIADVAGQDVRVAEQGPALELLIVDDRSSDATAAVADAAIAAAGLGSVGRVLRRPEGDGGKGAALAFAFSGADARPDTLVIVLDGDARISPEFVRLAAAAVRDGEAAGTARRRMLKPKAGRLARVLARLQDDEQTVDGEIQLGRRNLGGGSDLRGNGMIVPSDLLADVGGWPEAALCEDLELSSLLYLHRGIAARWLPGVEIWEQPVTSLGALFRQRARWAEGAVRRDLRITLPALLNPAIPARRRIAVGTYAAQTLVPLFAIGTALGGHRGRRTSLIRVLALSYAIAALGLAIDALRWSSDPRGRPMGLRERAIRASGVTVFGGLWAALGPLAWLRVATWRGAPAFTRTLHDGAFEPPGFAFSALSPWVRSGRSGG